MRRVLLILVLSLFAIPRCACPSANVRAPCTAASDCPAGQQCVAGSCQPGGGGGGGGGSVTGCNPSAADNAIRDTDCDGISDAEEYALDHGGQKTDPCKADSDGDGLLDGLEVGRNASVSPACSFSADADATTRTNPTTADTDGDGLADGAEDKNANGRVDPGEANPLKQDSDCDGLSDAAEASTAQACSTDPSKRDTDGDGVSDGVEQGVVAPGADPSCQYPAAAFDADTGTRTNPCQADSDGDGISDGAEDSNQNGKVDSAELNPNDGNDASGPAQEACATAKLKPIHFHSTAVGDVQLALVPDFSEVNTLVVSGKEAGFIFYDPTHAIAGVVFSRTPAGNNATEEETAARSMIGSTGTVSAPITQTFTTWDGFAQSVRATYDQSGNVDLKTRVNDLAKAFLGGSVGGTLSGTAGVIGPFKIQAEYVYRTNQRSAIVIALTPQATYSGDRIFRVDDVGGGTALAQFGDFTGTQCEVFTTQGSAKLDFLWVVDNSCSMDSYQDAVGNVGNLFAQKLGSAGLDWRVGAVTTWYYDTQPDEYRPFTTSVDTMKSWFLQGTEPPWFGASGRGDERGLESAKRYITNALLPKTTNPAQNKIRTGADLHLILLGDADDQGSTPIAAMNAFLANYDGAGSRAVVHGIVCPQGQECGEDQMTPRRNLNAIATSGGVLGDINIAQAGSPQLANTLDAILTVAIAGTGHQLQRPPISATIKVAMEPGATVGTCNTADVPRDRQHGFDFDAAARRIVFYGDCRPSAAGKKVAISYRYWIDNSPDPGGDPCEGKCAGELECNPSTATCQCPTDCGGCSAGLSCDLASCTCGPGIN